MTEESDSNLEVNVDDHDEEPEDLSALKIALSPTNNNSAAKVNMNTLSQLQSPGACDMRDGDKHDNEQEDHILDVDDRSTSSPGSRPTPQSTPNIKEDSLPDQCSTPTVSETGDSKSQEFEKSCIEVPGSVFVKWDITRKNKTSIVINGYKMTESRAGKDQRVFWRCSKRFCSATAISLGNQLLSVRQVSETQFHNHPPTAREEFFRGDFSTPGTLTNVILKWPVSMPVGYKASLMEGRTKNLSGCPVPSKRSRHDSRDTSSTPDLPQHPIQQPQQQQQQAFPSNFLDQIRQNTEAFIPQQATPQMLQQPRFQTHQQVFNINPLMSMSNMDAQTAFFSLAAKLGKVSYSTGAQDPKLLPFQHNSPMKTFDPIFNPPPFSAASLVSPQKPGQAPSPNQGHTAPPQMEHLTAARLTANLSDFQQSNFGRNLLQQNGQDSPLKEALSQADKCHLRRELQRLESYFQTGIVNLSSGLCRSQKEGHEDRDSLSNLLLYLKGLERVYNLIDYSDRKGSSISRSAQ